MHKSGNSRSNDIIINVGLRSGIRLEHPSIIWDTKKLIYLWASAIFRRICVYEMKAPFYLSPNVCLQYFSLYLVARRSAMHHSPLTPPLPSLFLYHTMFYSFLLLSTYGFYPLSCWILRPIDISRFGPDRFSFEASCSASGYPLSSGSYDLRWLRCFCSVSSLYLPLKLRKDWH